MRAPKQPKRPKLRLRRGRRPRLLRGWRRLRQPGNARPQRPQGAEPPPPVRPANNCAATIQGNNVPGHLAAAFVRGSESSEGSQTLRWTHVFYCSGTADVRDNYPNAPNTTATIGGTSFDIVFVELVRRGQPGTFKRVFLNRKAPAWPTNDL